MAWAFSIAVNEYNCPRCKAIKGKGCTTPCGKLTHKPHGKRVKCLTKADLNSCHVIASTSTYVFGNR